MTSTLTRVVLPAVILGCVVAGSCWVILENSEQRLSTSELAVGDRVRPPILPQVLRFSCSGRDVPLGNQFKTMRVDDRKLAVVTVEPTCMPEGDFIFSVRATPKEFLALTQTPTAEFIIAPNGQVVGARILHTSGSKELDAQILNLIERRKFKAGRCGGCRVETTVNVEF
jgi:TonB family protein